MEINNGKLYFDDDEIDDEQKNLFYVVYVLYVGKDKNENNIYQFLFSQNKEDVIGEAWGEVPASNISNEVLMIDKEFYSLTKEIKTTLSLRLAQDNNVFSMQDAKDGITCLAFEDISMYEEYPDPIRIVIHYGDTLKDVESMLKLRDIEMISVKEDNEI